MPPTTVEDPARALQAEGKFEEALLLAERSLAAAGDSVGLLHVAARCAEALGQLDEATAFWLRLFRIRPDIPEAHVRLAELLKDSKRFLAAETDHRRAIERAPSRAEAYNDHGNFLVLAGRFEQAKECYREALRISPGREELHANLALVHFRTGYLSEAEAECRSALRLKPSYVNAAFTLGQVLFKLGRLEESRDAFEQVVAIQPGHLHALESLAALLHETGDLAGALRRNTESAAAGAGNLQATLLRVPLCVPVVAQSEEISAAALAELDRALGALDEITARGDLRDAVLDLGADRPPFYLAYRYGNHRDRLSRYADCVTRITTARWQRSWPLARLEAGQKIRLGVVSGHLEAHPVFAIILQGILRHLDRERFEIILLQLNPGNDGAAEEARRLANRHHGPLSGPAQALEVLREEMPHVLFYPEIGMNADAFKLASLRLAGLQVASWGHPITTGLGEIDLFFSGELLEATDAEAHYRERLVRLPGTGVCTSPRRSRIEDVDLNELHPSSDSGAPVTRFVMCQMPSKFDPSDDELYARIAERSGSCQFWLVFQPDRAPLNGILRSRLANAFRRRGLEPDTYLRFAPWLPEHRFYGFLSHMDIYLDCPAFSGYTTAWQAVHWGLPTVTLEGAFLRQRLAAGLLRQAGVTDCIARSRDEYVDLAVSLGGDRQAREALRGRLIAAIPRVNDQTETVRAFERVIVEELQRKVGAIAA